jgi:hypothetical protein
MAKGCNIFYALNFNGVSNNLILYYSIQFVNCIRLLRHCYELCDERDVKGRERDLFYHIKNLASAFRRSQDSTVCIATGYGLENGGAGIRVPVWSRIFSSPRRPDRL